MSDQKIAYYLNFSDVIRILRLVDETPFHELQFELEGLKLRVVQDKRQQASAPPSVVQPTASETARLALSEPVRELVTGAAIQAPLTSADTDGEPVIAPLAGTFYRSPLPGEPPFVEVGATVKQGDVVGILEIMKLMNHVMAPCAGVIAKICAQNEEFVEFGQVLAVIDPELVE